MSEGEIALRLTEAWARQYKEVSPSSYTHTWEVYEYFLEKLTNKPTVTETTLYADGEPIYKTIKNTEGNHIPRID